MSDLRAALRHPELHVKQAETVRLAWIDPGTVDGRFMESVLALMMADHNKPPNERRILTKGGGYIRLETGPRIASARNRVVRLFLEESENDWLLMIDTDMTFDNNAVDLLLERADPKTRPIVGGLCFGGGHGTIFPTMYECISAKDNDGELVRWITEWEDGELVRVDATGAAFLLIHRSVLEKMALANPEPYPWFSEGAIGTHEFGEDWMFCIRAMKLGIPIYVDTRVKIGHRKTTVLSEETWRQATTDLRPVGFPAPAPEPELAEVGAE